MAVLQLLIQLTQQWELFLCLPFLLLLARIAFAGRGLKLPPGPWRLPVLGNLHQLGALPHRNLAELARRHGPVMLLRLGAKLTLVVSSASAAREVLRTHDADCCSRPASPGPKLLSYGYKDVAFAPHGQQWREMRMIFITELVSMRRVKAAWGARQVQVDKLMAGLTPNEPVALGERIYGVVYGIIGSVAFGGVEMSADKFHRVLDDALELQASFSAEDFFPNAAGRLLDRLTGLVASRDRCFAEIDAFFDMVIEQHLDPKREGSASDLVDVLLNLSKERPDFTMEHVKAMIMDTFVGGVHTSSVTILWAMSELIRNPRVLKKVQDEIRAVAAGNGSGQRVQPDDMHKLNYLKMVVKETLRLYPPAPLLLPRETMRQVRIGGYYVPAKARVLVNVWATGRDPASWGEDAGEFNPDRFLESEVSLHGAHFQLLPFGAGQRICPGIAMALANVEFTLANILCGFQWELPEGTKAEDVSTEETGGLTFHRKTPLLLVPTPYVPPIRAMLALDATANSLVVG